MGLTIHYELTLPGETADEDAIRLLERLHAHAATLGKRDTLPLFQFTGAALSQPDEGWERGSLEWLLHTLTDGMREHRDGVVEEIADPSRLAAACFVVNPGEGCEMALFGLVRPLVTQRPRDAHGADGWQSWYWQCFCKTQYASAVSDEHFVHCHTTVVHMLDEARRLGFGVTVHDEAEYWETRSEEVLLRQVRHMDRIIAHFAGALHDKLSPDQRVEAPIFEHPDFERLETEPIDGDERG